MKAGIALHNFKKLQTVFRKKKKIFAIEFSPVDKDDFIKAIVINGNVIDLKLKEWIFSFLKLHFYLFHILNLLI